MDKELNLSAKTSVVNAIREILRAKNWMLGIAESCTGGWIGKIITDVAGISDVFAGGVITYSNQMKCTLLGVDKKILTDFGEVSKETALAMVSGLVNRYGVEVGIAVTGIAGPGGGSEKKPVGLVYIATRIHNEEKVCEYHFSPDRANIRDQSCISALKQLLNHLTDSLNKSSD